MKSFFVFLFCCTFALAEEAKQRAVSIRDWVISVPTDAEDHITDGPDFSITYIILPAQGAQLGIYEGGHPQEFASKEKDVTMKPDTISGQKVVWSIWKTKAQGRQIFRAEVFMVCAVHQSEPGMTYDEKFHIFLTAPDGHSLSALQDVVRTLKKKEPNQAAQTTPGS